MRYLPVLKLAAPLACALFAAPVLAQATNLGFESGDLTGWTQHGGDANATPAPWAPQTSGPTFTAYEGNFFGFVTAGENEDYATLSQTFALFAGGTISGVAGFANFDGYDAELDHFFNDKGYLAVNGVKILQWDGESVGSGANSGWDPFLFTAAETGLYTLEIGVANGDDPNLPSSVLLDAVHLTGQVPEAATWAMMAMGFGLAGTALRARRRAVRFG